MINPGAGALEHAASYVDIGRRTGRPPQEVSQGKSRREVDVLRSLANRMPPPVGTRSVTAARVLAAARVAGLVVVLVTVPLARPGPATGGPRGTAIAVMLGVCAAAWIAWVFSAAQGPADDLEPGRDGGSGRRARRADARTARPSPWAASRCSARGPG